MNKVLLSICIATYNRANFIGETLDSITSQLTEEVEILVVDGASTDNTGEVINGYLKRCERIRYVRLPSKGGVDHDYNQAVELARGEYCWLFTDDDIIKPGALQTVLDQIRKGYDLIIINGEVRSIDLLELVEERRLPILKNKIYFINDFEQFFIDNTSYISFIGCVVIKKSVWQGREKEKYYGLEFIHIGVIFQKQFDSDILVIAKPLIVIRFGNAQWSLRTFEIEMFKWPNLIWSLASFTDTAKTIITLKEPWRKVTKLMLLRARGHFDSEQYFRFVRPRISCFLDRALIRIITLVPGYLVNTLAIIYYSLKSPHNPLVFFTLKNSRYNYLKFYKTYLKE
jgi:abequosyltransferase